MKEINLFNSYYSTTSGNLKCVNACLAHLKNICVFFFNESMWVCATCVKILYRRSNLKSFKSCLHEALKSGFFAIFFVFLGRGYLAVRSTDNSEVVAVVLPAMWCNLIYGRWKHKWPVFAFICVAITIFNCQQSFIVMSTLCNDTMFMSTLIWGTY